MIFFPYFCQKFARVKTGTMATAMTTSCTDFKGVHRGIKTVGPHGSEPPVARTGHHPWLRPG